ncbi:PEP-CTERM sorting domain-containing protein [Kordiimonas aquimaris]|uniref:PEP-CTERM sorting domain-containing protein n=1 Tax=Kordiimonas aquimaris TaxID=707591 RepID=UPI0021D0AE72|nr:PEP-CTERM sorting domain-containing protein [Kordiimonas aquimaris]
MINRLINRLVILTAGTLLLSMPSQARQPYVDVTSDIGTFQPVTLGEDINVSPCGSTVSTTNQSFLNSICNVGYPDGFSIHYLISFGGITSALSFGTAGTGVTDSIATLVANRGGTVQSLGNTAAGLTNVALSTGIGSLFSTAGTYVISLVTAIQAEANTIDNIRGGGDSGLVLANTGFDINGASVGSFDGVTIGTLGVVSGGNPSAGNGRRDVAFSQATIVVEAAAVPEPSSWLMLLMGLMLIGRRQFSRRLPGLGKI